MTNITEQIKDSEELEITRTGIRQLKVTVDLWKDDRKSISFMNANGEHIFINEEQILLVLQFINESLRNL